MGSFKSYKCEKCGYEYDDYEGTGRGHAEKYNEILESMKSGKLGDKPAEFFKDNPEGIIDISCQSMKCLTCGRYESVERMTMLSYIDDRAKRNCRRTVSRYYKDWSDIEFFTKDYVRSSFTRYFIEREYFDHKCSECGGVLMRFDDFNNATCPKCGHKLIENGGGLWD